MSDPRPPIVRFRDEYAWLSNFSPALVSYGKYGPFATVENAYQFAKIPKDRITDVLAAELMKATPAKTKAFGKALKEKDGLRPDWAEIKVRVMRYLLDQKFAIPELREQLLRTGQAEIIEGNLHHDNEWGDCQCTIAKKDERKYGQKQKCHMRGKNLLGLLLMEVRAVCFLADPYRCPQCGSPEKVGQEDTVPCFAPGVFKDGLFEFDDEQETKIDWLRQGPRHDPPRYWCTACALEFTVPPQKIGATAPAASETDDHG